MKKVVFFAFQADPTCFIHVLLNALDLKEKGFEIRIVMEGAATRLVPELSSPEHPLHGLYAKAKEQELFHGACRACSAKLGTLEAVRREGFRLLEDMSGHPGMAGYLSEGYEIVTF